MNDFAFVHPCRFVHFIRVTDVIDCSTHSAVSQNTGINNMDQQEQGQGARKVRAGNSPHQRDSMLISSMMEGQMVGVMSWC